MQNSSNLSVFGRDFFVENVLDMKRKKYNDGCTLSKEMDAATSIAELASKLSRYVKKMGALQKVHLMRYS